MTNFSITPLFASVTTLAPLLGHDPKELTLWIANAQDNGRFPVRIHHTRRTPHYCWPQLKRWHEALVRESDLDAPRFASR